jgi:hypothetical protein
MSIAQTAVIGALGAIGLPTSPDAVRKLAINAVKQDETVKRALDALPQVKATVTNLAQLQAGLPALKRAIIKEVQAAILEGVPPANGNGATNEDPESVNGTGNGNYNENPESVNGTGNSNYSENTGNGNSNYNENPGNGNSNYSENLGNGTSNNNENPGNRTSNNNENPGNGTSNYNGNTGNGTSTNNENPGEESNSWWGGARPRPNKIAAPVIRQMEPAAAARRSTRRKHRRASRKAGRKASRRSSRRMNMRR